MPADRTEKRTAAERLRHRTARTRQMIVFAMLGAIMFISKIIMEAALPNMHLVGVLTVAYTLVYRKKALIPVYVYVFLLGLYYGFASWWLIHLYIWLFLWGTAMLVPKKLPVKIKIPIAMAVCSLHGFIFGILSAPANALIYGLSFEAMFAWIAAGFSFDIMHGIHNLYLGALIVPLAMVIERFEKKSGM